MIGHALPMYKGYSSQYGHGLGNVLGGVVRAAVPMVANLAKKAGAKLLHHGIDYLQEKISKKRKAPASKVNYQSWSVEMPSMQPVLTTQSEVNQHLTTSQWPDHEIKLKFKLEDSVQEEDTSKVLKLLKLIIESFDDEQSKILESF